MPPPAQRPAGWILWAPLTAASVSLALLTVRLPAIIEAISWNGDAVAPAIIAERAGEPGGAGTTVLGDISSASTLWFQLATRGLPGHRLVWELAPVAVAVATAGLIGWAALRLAGRRAGALAAALVMAAGSDALLTLLAPAFRGPTWLSCAVLAALLVALATRPERPRPATVALVAAAGAIVGVNLASDPLLLVAGVLPLAGAALAVWARDRSVAARRVVGWTAATCAVALASALAAAIALAAAGFTTRRAAQRVGYLDVAGPGQLAAHLRTLGEGVLSLAGAPGVGGLASGWGPVRWPLALLTLAALTGALWPRRARAQAPRPAPLSLARRLHAAFWGLSALLVGGAYLLSGIPSGERAPGVPSSRYLVPLFLAAAAVLPLALERSPGRRASAALAATALAVGGGIGLARGDLERAERPPLSAEAGRIADWLDARGVRAGYASYWTAGPLSYHTGLRVRAVRACFDAAGRTLCPVALNARPSWYRPRRAPSFVVLDATVPNDAWVIGGAWEPRFGAPARRRRFGRIMIYVYPYDVAARFPTGAVFAPVVP